MQVVIIYESLTGNTERAARLIADAFYDHQVASKVYPVGGFDPVAVAEADLVVAGSWTDGLFVVGQKPAKRKKFTALPDLTGKQCVVFCTYALNPGKTLDKFTAVLAGQGAEVLGGMAIRRNDLAGGATDLVTRIMDLVSV
jgi:Flavodoxin domain